MTEKIDTTHALVVNTIIIATGNRKDMFKECKKLKTEDKSSQVFLFPNGTIGDKLGY